MPVGSAFWMSLLRPASYVVFSTFGLWGLSAALVYARYRPEWRGRRVMVLTDVAFAALAFTMVGVGLVLPTAHGGRPSAAGGAP